jgi:hypothetical protein
MTDLPPLLRAALQRRAETDISRLFLPDELSETDGPVMPERREPASVVGEPSDAELLAFVPQGSSESDFHLPEGLPSNWVDGDFIAPPEAIVAFARAVLARYGHQAGALAVKH